MNTTAKLENWIIQKYGDKEICWGNVYNDQKGRFKDGSLIRTSIIEKREGNIITTLNSSYELGTEMAKGL